VLTFDLPEGTMDLDASPTVIEELLEHFASAALGLTLEVRVTDVSDLPVSHRTGLTHSQSSHPVWAAWRTDRGPVSACAAYDHEHAQRVQAHVLLIEWWIAIGEHHDGWWRCDPQRPGEWIKGRGA
jgi:hypothetical protein